MNIKYRGFTLIEILIALTIMAIVGVLMSMGLRIAVNTQQRIAKKAEQLTAIQMAVIIIERDINQIINRPILDASSMSQPAVALKQTNNDISFEFTRAGVINPFSLQNRSTLQRIRYHYDGKNLTRTFWKQLDTTKDTPSETEVLLTNLQSFHINLIKKKEQNNPESINAEPQLPLAIEISFENASFGLVTRFIKLIGDIS